MTERDGCKERLTLERQIIVFIGPEGAGKTTQALSLAKATGRPYVSTGDIIRDLAANDFETRYGEACRKMFAEHAYLDGPTLLEILALRLGRDDMIDGFILDGGMRTVEETQEFQTVLNAAGRGDLHIKVIQLETPESESISRLAGEGGRNRFDDTIEGVRSRLSKYHFQLEQRLALIAQTTSWELIPVDASGSIDETHGKLIEVITGTSLS